MKKAILSLTLFLALGFGASRVNAQISVGISVHVAPPAIPVYTQPACPVDGYLWVPGYWAWDDDEGYYWVPGYWAAPPTVGFLWTPGYWGWGGGVYAWHAGYWGPHIGFYGGVNYGFGYGGVGYVGGMWAGSHFQYNTAVVNVNTTVVHNTYVNNTVVNNTTVVNRSSFNGQGGVTATPNAQERVAMNENHTQPTSEQFEHNRTASLDKNQLASNNNGHPSTTAMNRVNGRAYNQQGRIANGIATGRMSASQASHIEGREANVDKEIHNDRAANGGTLTPQERQHINKQQNNMSKTIYNDKHPNANHGGGGGGHHAH